MLSNVYFDHPILHGTLKAFIELFFVFSIRSKSKQLGPWEKTHVYAGHDKYYSGTRVMTDSQVEAAALSSGCLLKFTPVLEVSIVSTILSLSCWLLQSFR